MALFEEYVNKIEELDKRDRMEEVLEWIHKEYPELEPVIKWNSPMYLHHGTFINSADCAKAHMSIAPEPKAVKEFAEKIDAAGYSKTKGLFRIKHNEEVDYKLIGEIIEYNMKDKEGYDKLWR